MRKRSAKILNSKGSKLNPLKLGDYVKIYIFSSHSETVRRNHKSKHTCQWRGPLEIVHQLSNTTFEIQSYFETKKYMRHISNMRRWHGLLPDANPLPETIAPLNSDLEVGEFAFQCNSLHKPMLYLAEVTSIGEIGVHVNAWGTTSENHLNRKYKPIFLVGAGSSPSTDASLGSDPARGCGPYPLPLLTNSSSCATSSFAQTASWSQIRASA